VHKSTVPLLPKNHGGGGDCEPHGRGQEVHHAIVSGGASNVQSLFLEMIYKGFN
jgi:hypothetical protein